MGMQSQPHAFIQQHAKSSRIWPQPHPVKVTAASDAAQGEAQHAVAMPVGQTIDAMLIILELRKPADVSLFPGVCIAACQCSLRAMTGAVSYQLKTQNWCIDSGQACSMREPCRSTEQGGILEGLTLLSLAMALFLSLCCRSSFS